MFSLWSLCLSHSGLTQTYTPFIERIKKCALEGNNAASFPSARLSPGILFPSTSISLSDSILLFAILVSSSFAISFVVRTGLEFSFALNRSIASNVILVLNSLFTAFIASCAFALSISGITRLPPITTMLSNDLPVNWATNFLSFISVAESFSSPIVADVTAKLT